MTPRSYATQLGRHLPPGAQADAGGVNFSLLARDAAAVELRLFERADSEAPFQVIALDPGLHRTFFFWHVYVEGLTLGAHYTWRVAGLGQQLESTPVLLDPWARSGVVQIGDIVVVSTPRDPERLRASGADLPAIHQLRPSCCSCPVRCGYC